jgi:hypothetical protein
MNSLGRSARGALILLVALVVGVWVISRTSDSPAGAGTDVAVAADTTAVPVSTTTTTLLPPRNPKAVRVLMVNGTLTNGIAKLAGKCVATKYDLIAPKNATVKPLAASALYANSLSSAEAVDVAATLGFAGSAVPFPVDPGVRDFPTPAPDVMLIIGDDMAQSIRNLPCAQSPA